MVAPWPIGLPGLNKGLLVLLTPQVIEVQTLFLRHHSALRVFVLSILPDATATDDIVQEVFLVATKHAEDFRLGSNFFRLVARLLVGVFYPNGARMLGSAGSGCRRRAVRGGPRAGFRSPPAEHAGRLPRSVAAAIAATHQAWPSRKQGFARLRSF